jgi:hypothetical protein
VDAAQWREQRDEGRALLTRYFEWAPTVDRFAPVLVETDFEVNVFDPARPGTGLLTAAGEPIRYSGRIDMMAVDQDDAYWIVRHRVVDKDWLPTEQLVADEETLTACWAWRRLRTRVAAALSAVRQHEPSGGRSIPQHRRMYARARELLPA